MQPNKTRNLLLGTALVAVVFGAGKLGLPALAADTAVAAGNLIDRDFQDACRKHFEKKFFHNIGATSEQQAKIDKLVENSMDETLPMREKLKQGLLDLNDMAAKDDTTDDQIVQKAHELRALHEQIADRRLQTVLAVRQELTGDQRKQIASRIKGLISGDFGRSLLLNESTKSD
jgi:Spy/CpxP family protein refolding chaperone